MDGAYHDTWARSIADGNLMGEEPFFRAPLYPYVLGLIYRVSHGSYLVPRIVQFLLGSLTCVIVFLLTARLAGKVAALIAGILCATYPVLIYFDGEILTENLFTFLVMLGIYLLELARRGSSRLWFAAGVTFGFALITRPTIGLFLPLIAIGSLMFTKRRAMTLLIVVGMVLPVIPVTMHNYLVSGEFIPVVWQAGINFYLGNNPEANGWSATSPEIRKDWWGGYRDMIAIPKSILGRQPTYREVSKYWTSKGLHFIRNQPVQWLKLMLKKTALFFNRQEFPNNQDYNFIRTTSPILMNPIVGFGTVAPIALVGLLFCLSKVRTYFYIVAFVIAYFFATIAFFVCARYRAPAVPALCILAAIAIATCVRCALRRKYGRLAAWLICVSGFALLVNFNLTGEHLPDFAQSYTQMSKALIENGNLDEALEYCDKALQVNPKWAEAYEQIGLIEMSRGNYNQAIAFLSKATEVLPNMATAYRALAMVYLKQDRLDKARIAVEKCLRSAPFIEDGYNLLATLERKQGNVARAEELFKKEVELHPDNWRAWVNLGSLYHDEDRLEEAISAYEQATKINPVDPDIALALASLYTQIGRDEEARSIIKQLGSSASTNINLRYNQAVILQQSGRLEEARSLYEEILRINPNHEGSLVNLGVIYAREGKPEQARQMWEAALEVNPSNMTARRNLDLLLQHR